MKYLTKEELEDIANSLLDNPSYETLKELNNKYNKEEIREVPETIPEKQNLSETSNIPVSNMINKEMQTQNNVPVEEPVTMPEIKIHNMESLTSQNQPNPNYNQSVNNQGNQPINFTGNLFEQPFQNTNNLMGTTDNFNQQMPNTTFNSNPFFGTNNTPVNNQIPVSGNVTSGPSMFGQIMQNNSQL